MKKFRDPIHGFISISSVELKIIDSPIFQRTRNIKQLSLGHYAYHGAEHSRFGHMIGAAHIAGCAFDSLKQNAEDGGEKFQADELDRATLRMAALLHDIGHTPFSHSLENVLGPPHEEYSQKLVKVCFEDMLKKEDIDVNEVNNLIAGAYPKKPYLGNIVSGQLDVDRLDYILRDSYYSGVSYGQYDLDRIIAQLAVVDGQFVVLDGGYEAVEQMIFARYQMYQQVYFHKTKRVFELMLRECGEMLKNDLNYPTPKDLDDDSVVEEYAEYDDRWFLNSIFRSQNSAVRTIADMIRRRKPYLEVYSPAMDRHEPKHSAPGPYDSTGRLEAIQDALQNNLSSIGIMEHEFLLDESSRLPYKLMPDYDQHEDEERNSIYIHYKNRHHTEPIERRSHVVFALGMHQPYIIRGFVVPSKYDTIKGYMESTHNFVLPDRK